MSVLDASTIFLIFFAIVICVLIAKKVYYRIIYKKKFIIIPRVSSKGIANIGMVVALSVAVIILLAIITADFVVVIFRAWPGTRIILESVLIKIGGLLFGPIIGLCIGAATDFLTVALTSGVFHLGYFISAMFFGLIGGIIQNIVSLSNKNELKFTVLSTILFVISAVLSFFIIYYIAGNQNVNKVFYITFLGVDIHFNLLSLIGITIGFITIATFFMWILYFLRKKHLYNVQCGKLLEETYYTHFNHTKLYKINYQKFKHIYRDTNKNTLSILAWICSNNGLSYEEINHKFNYTNMNNKLYYLIQEDLITKKDNKYFISENCSREFISSSYKTLTEWIWTKRYHSSKNNQIFKKTKDTYMSFMPVYTCVLLSEILVNILMIPSFDALLSPLNYDTWLLIRVLLFIPMILLNLIIIYPVFRIISPNIKYNYEEELIEELNKK